MRVVLTAIRPSDERPTEELAPGEVVDHEVDLQRDGDFRTFKVYLKARVLPAFDASALHGEPALEELLRYEPRALSALLAAVGKVRRHERVALPMVLADHPAEPSAEADPSGP